MKGQQSHNGVLAHLFRQEYAKMTAALCRHFGLVNIEVAEDIASETFPKASEYWAVNGVPENPTAWLYTVAKKALSLIKSNIQKSALLKEITRLSQMINNA